VLTCQETASKSKERRQPMNIKTLIKILRVALPIVIVVLDKLPRRA